MGSEITLLIGHRGTGKTTYLKNLLLAQPGLAGFDLDAEIAVRTGEGVGQILARSEAEFRNTERRVLGEILHGLRGPAVIAVGAGFEGPLPRGVHVLWLRRTTDALGRVFQNRPRLEPRLSPFAEYTQRFAKRDARYRTWAHEELFVPEGWDGVVPAPQTPFDLTLLPENFRDWPAFWAKRKDWPVRRFELRDDLLSADDVERARRDIPAERLLWCCRRTDDHPAQLEFDWPVEMGRAPAGAAILSLHEGEWARLHNNNLDGHALLKLAVRIDTWEDLRRGHAWWLEDPERRAFLPRSEDGRWQWYRSLFGPRMPIHFVREGDGSSLDQPFLWQSSALQAPFHRHFGAVLGHPVAHSRSPMEHRALGPFVAIDVREDEFPSALPFLQELGLRYAAVTAPLKRLAGNVVGIEVANTLWWQGERWHGSNTDEIGLRELAVSYPADDVWVWGQGAMLASISKVWPRAQAISARTGTLSAGTPDILIWATGRNRPFVWPPDGCRPKLVLDLNYGEDSPGLEYAVRNSLPYQSGLKLFKLQASAQRQAWKAADL